MDEVNSLEVLFECFFKSFVIRFKAFPCKKFDRKMRVDSLSINRFRLYDINSCGILCLSLKKVTSKWRKLMVFDVP